jgi:hypothetical protein
MITHTKLFVDNCQISLLGSANLHGGFSKKKNRFPSISFFRAALPAREFSIRILLFG